MTDSNLPNTQELTEQAPEKIERLEEALDFSQGEPLITIHNNFSEEGIPLISFFGGEGKLHYDNGSWSFEGNVELSAMIFFNAIVAQCRNWRLLNPQEIEDAKIKEESREDTRQKELEALYKAKYNSAERADYEKRELRAKEATFGEAARG